jgi:hypothetical protein
MNTRVDMADVEVVAPNLKRRLSGVVNRCATHSGTKTTGTWRGGFGPRPP